MTPAHQLPAGTRVPAGLGHATVLPDADFETYSEAGCYFDPLKQRWHGPHRAPQGKKGLPVVGAAVYAMHPSTEVLTFSYDLKDGAGSRLWLPGMGPPSDLFDYLAQGGLMEAWNVAFEWWIWNYVCTRRYGWPTLSYLQTRDAMAKARASCWPGKLETAGAAMGVDVQKDKRGAALLDRFSKPRNPTKADLRLRHTLAEFPQEAGELMAYNTTDIHAEAAVSIRCPDLEGEELDFWLVDQLINRRGVGLDVVNVEHCAALVNACLAHYNAELATLTGGAVSAASEVQALRGWLAAWGVYTDSLDEENVDALLAQDRIQGAPRRALELRQRTGSASVKKVFAMLNQVSPLGRLHDMFNYHGARTGRPTGEGPQPTNMPKAGPDVLRCACGRWHGRADRCPWCGAAITGKLDGWTWEAVDDVLACIATRNVGLVEHYFGDALLCVSGVLRSMFIAAPGCTLMASDFSAIEGVVTAAIAGEEWRLEVFRTHGKIYEMSVAKITGTPFADIMAHAGYDITQPRWWEGPQIGKHHPLRQGVGKVAELASGFGGWVGSWKAFGADKYMADDDAIKQAVLAWREASPAIVELWGGQERRVGRQRIPELFGLEGMAIRAVLEPRTWHPVMRRDGTHTGVTYGCDGNTLYCVLPSGRALSYQRPRLEANPREFGGPYQLTFEGYNSNPKKGAMGWARFPTYGGSLCENVVQATARDIQRFAILNLERAGYHVVLHVYDEDVAEVPVGWGSVEEMERIMSTMPAWANYKGEPWPIRANGGWMHPRYRKG